MTSAAPSSPISRLESRFLRPYRGWLALGLLGLLLQSTLLLPVPLLQGWVLDHLLPLAREGASADPLAIAAARRVTLLSFAAIAACWLVKSAVSWTVATRMGRISQEVVVALRSELHAKLMRLPMSYFDAQQTGRLMARVTSDVGSILTFINSGSLQLVNDLILAAGIAVMLFWLQWRLALAAIVVVPLYAVNHRFFASKIHALSLDIRAQIAALYALLSERVSAARVVRSYTREADELAALDRRIDTHRELSLKNTRAHAMLGALATMISGLGTVFVICYGAHLVGRSVLTIGELLAFYALIGQLYGPIVRLTQFQATAVATQVSVERLFEIFDEPESIADAPGALPLEHPRGRVTLSGVTFSYTPGGRDVLTGVDLDIVPGQTVGLLGPSGSGKSTLLALLPRLYDVEPGRGSVLVDGLDVRALKLADLRRAVALVPQRAMLFEGTLRSNLLYANPDATDSMILQVLESSDLASTVATFPLGLDTPVGERGLSLSGGQRQRLALARALLARPAVLLLDDCTSALDAETESRIQKALRDGHPGQTRVIVSHKISSVRHADLILVLDDGLLVERGTHDDLLALGGHYASVYDQQARALETSSRF